MYAFVKKNCILNVQNNPPQEGLKKPVSVNHQVNIEVEESIEGEEVSDRGVVGVETSDKVVLEDAEAKLGVDDRSCQQDYHSHEADDELQPGLDKLHCSQLSKGLEWNGAVTWFYRCYSGGNLGCQVEYVDDISGQQNKKESSKPEKVIKV